MNRLFLKWVFFKYDIAKMMIHDTNKNFDINFKHKMAKTNVHNRISN